MKKEAKDRRLKDDGRASSRDPRIEGDQGTEDGDEEFAGGRERRILTGNEENGESRGPKHNVDRVPL